MLRNLFSRAPLAALASALLAATSLLAGCASPGEPTTRRPPIPTPIGDLAAKQQGNEVILTFKIPNESDRPPSAEANAGGGSFPQRLAGSRFFDGPGSSLGDLETCARRYASVRNRGSAHAESPGGGRRAAFRAGFRGSDRDRRRVHDSDLRIGEEAVVRFKRCSAHSVSFLPGDCRREGSKRARRRLDHLDGATTNRHGHYATSRRLPHLPRRSFKRQRACDHRGFGSADSLQNRTSPFSASAILPRRHFLIRRWHWERTTSIASARSPHTTRVNSNPRIRI